LDLNNIFPPQVLKFRNASGKSALETKKIDAQPFKKDCRQFAGSRIIHKFLKIVNEMFVFTIGKEKLRNQD